MEIEYQGKKYKIKFIHHRLVKNGIIQTKGGITYAFISDKDKKPIHEGIAIASEKDNYNKKLGRIISAGRLLKLLGIPREGLKGKV